MLHDVGVTLFHPLQEERRSEEHTSELQSQSNLVCRLLLEKKNHVISFDVPHEEIVIRLSGRRGCFTCQTLYHIEHDPPNLDRVCDMCSAALVERADDTPDT